MVMKFKPIYFFIALVVIAGLLVGCSSTTPAPAGTTAPGTTSASSQVVAKTPSKSWPDAISIAGTAMGSTGYTVAIAIADMVKKHVGITATGEAASGPVENMANLNTKQIEIGFSNTWDAFHCTHGSALYTGKGLPELRTIMRGHPNLLVFAATASSGINSPADIKGKRVAYGAITSGSAMASFNAMLKALNLTKEDMKLIPCNGNQEVNDAIKGGMADAGYFPGGIPNPQWKELADTMDLKFISMDDALLKACLTADPSLSVATIPANTYRGQDKPVQGLGMVAVWTTKADFPEDLVYAIDKAIYDNYDAFAAYHPACKDYKLKDALLYPTIPFHAGAIQYFKDKGIWTAEAEQTQQKLLKDIGQTK
jgi:TRAP transporter TAXI family solute receptor